jgi:hypothetical protein
MRGQLYPLLTMDSVWSARRTSAKSPAKASTGVQVCKADHERVTQVGVVKLWGERNRIVAKQTVLHEGAADESLEQVIARPIMGAPPDAERRATEARVLGSDRQAQIRFGLPAERLTHRHCRQKVVKRELSSRDASECCLSLRPH